MHYNNQHQQLTLTTTNANYNDNNSNDKVVKLHQKTGLLNVDCLENLN